MDYLIGTALVTAAYLAGSVSFAVVVCALLKLPDPRTRGSGNPGATNVTREIGKWPGILTLCGDIGKAVIPMLLARSLGGTETTVALVGAAAFIGHAYPLFHGFKGGKGVATFLGILAVLQWQVALVWLAVWLAVLALFRYISLASMISAAASAAYAWNAVQNRQVAILVLAMATLILIRHRSNVHGLLK